MNEATQRQVEAVRSGAGLFRLAGRGLLSVTGDDRVRWLDGMLSNDVRELAADAARSGCHALLLTAKGRIVANLHVLGRKDAFWLETAASAVAVAKDTLEHHVIADDVAVVDLSTALERIGIEGPSARAALEAASGAAIELAPHGWTEVWLADFPVTVARFGWSVEDGYQLWTPLEAREAVAATVLESASSVGLIEAGTEALEILRVEAGTPRMGAELDETVLPAEANLEEAVSQTKGCYVGQEVVARMHSRGRVSHRLVGLRVVGAGLPEAGSELFAAGRRIGELTSVCVSPRFGPIALGFVRAAHAAVGNELAAGGSTVRVCGLPFTHTDGARVS
jgi:folate-binding protein YgfZ